MTWLEAAIIAFIILSIGYVVWRGGAANPEGTRSLGEKVSGLASKVVALSGRVGHVENEMKELKQEAATTKDIDRLEGMVDEKLKTVMAQMDGHRELSAATNRNVDRIVNILLEKGLGK